MSDRDEWLARQAEAYKQERARLVETHGEASVLASEKFAEEWAHEIVHGTGVGEPRGILSTTEDLTDRAARR